MRAVLANSAKEVDLTDPSGKRLWIGVETDPSFPNEALTTKASLESALSALDASYAARPGHAGWAVHQYAFWSVMPGY